MRYLIITILIGLVFGGIALAGVRYDWTFGEPATVIWDNASTTGAYVDRVEWVFGEPTVVASSTPTGAAPAAEVGKGGAFQCISGHCEFIGGISRFLSE